MQTAANPAGDMPRIGDVGSQGSRNAVWMLQERKQSIIFAILILAAAGLPNASEAASEDLSASMDKVQTWLKELGVDETVQKQFIANEVDVGALLLFNRGQLDELGVTQLGRQAKLMAKAKQEQEVHKRHGVASIRTNTYGDSTNKGGIQFCTKDEGSAEVGVKAVLSAEGRFGIGVKGEPEAKLHVKGDAIFAAGHCDRIHAQLINASVDVQVQKRSLRESLEKLDAADEELRAADTAGAMRLQEEVGVVNSSFSKQLEAAIAAKDQQIARLSAVLDEHIVNLTLSLTEHHISSQRMSSALEVLQNICVAEGCFDFEGVCSFRRCGHGDVARGTFHSDCSIVESGDCYSYYYPDKDVVKVVNLRGSCQKPICGNGQRTYSEGCDDGNLIDGDGCSAQCSIESGFRCSGGRPATPCCDKQYCDCEPNASWSTRSSCESHKFCFSSAQGPDLCQKTEENPVGVTPNEDRDFFFLGVLGLPPARQSPMNSQTLTPVPGYGTDTGTFQVRFSDISATSYSRGVLTPTQKIIMVPYYAQNVRIYDCEEDNFYTVPTPTTTSA